MILSQEEIFQKLDKEVAKYFIPYSSLVFPDKYGKIDQNLHNLFLKNSNLRESSLFKFLDNFFQGKFQIKDICIKKENNRVVYTLVYFEGKPLILTEEIADTDWFHEGFSFEILDKSTYTQFCKEFTEAIQQHLFNEMHEN